MIGAGPPKAVHAERITVGWGHCDAAGIVYFPRFFEMFHAAMESWFGARLGLPYAEAITRRKIGFPSVHTEADFRKPTGLGETVTVELRVGKVGRSSVELCYVVRGSEADDDVRVTGRTVVALMNLDPTSAGYRRGLPIPDELRAMIEAFAAGG